ncbi:nucleolin-like [Anopheles moucheti]|uniref:nucleolin-like n=1 Tax=Anopheles moucheti TaxID=186751 RepID=UPI0022F11869|nr:nucleolin-like [Anopheles moucheti]
MAVKSKNQTPPKKLSVSKKAALMKKDLNPEDDDMLDSEEEDDDMMELEDDESIAPDDNSDDDEEMEVEAPTSAKKTKLAKGKLPPSKEPKGKGADKKQEKAKKSANAEGPSTPTGKQTNGTKKPAALALTQKDSRSERVQRTVCVKHLRPNSTDEEIVKFFASAGKCTVAKRVRSKAMAMVLLESTEQIEKAICLNGKSLNGHAVIVERSKFLDREDVLNEKKKLRTKKRKLERRKMARQQAAGVDKKEPITEANGKEQKKGKKGKQKVAGVDKAERTTAANDKGPKKNKQKAAGVAKKESTTVFNGKAAKKSNTNKKEGGSKSKKLGKGKDVASPTAAIVSSKPVTSASESKATKKKESKGKKVTK